MIFAYLRSLLKKINSVGLMLRIMGITLLIAVLLGTVTILEVRSMMQVTLADELERRGISIARDVAARSQDLILTKNLFALYRLAADTVNNNRDVLYVVILDSQGQVLAHTFGLAYPGELIRANPVESGAKFRVESFQPEEGLVYDMAVPVLEGRAGVARVALTEHSLEATVNKVTSRIFGSILVVSLIGVGAAFLLTRFLTAPIRRLVEDTKAVASGDLKRKAIVVFNDEVGRLARAFNYMTERLDSSYRELEESRHLVIRQIMTAQEEERKRIARELHDETSQSLTSLIVGLRLVEEAVSPEEIRSRLEDLRKLVGQTLAGVHDLARQLRPSALDDLGLVETLSRFIAELRARSGIDAVLELSGGQDRRFAPEVETALYRIVQEALTNVVKHAQADRVDVIVKNCSDEVSVIVEDNGCGFAADEPESVNCLGICGMRERVFLFGGTFSIESQPGSGTTVFVRIPLDGNGLQGGVPF